MEVGWEEDGGGAKRKVPEGSLSSNRKGARSGKTAKKIVAVSQGSRSSELRALRRPIGRCQHRTWNIFF